jgi:hypothetical protein
MHGKIYGFFQILFFIFLSSWFLNIEYGGHAQWFTSIISATQEEEKGGSQFEARWTKSYWHPVSKNKLGMVITPLILDKGTRIAVQGQPWENCEILSEKYLKQKGIGVWLKW